MAVSGDNGSIITSKTLPLGGAQKIKKMVRVGIGYNFDVVSGVYFDESILFDVDSLIARFKINVIKEMCKWRFPITSIKSRLSIISLIVNVFTTGR